MNSPFSDDFFEPEDEASHASLDPNAIESESEVEDDGEESDSEAEDPKERSHIQDILAKSQRRGTTLSDVDVLQKIRQIFVLMNSLNLDLLLFLQSVFFHPKIIDDRSITSQRNLNTHSDFIPPST